MASLENLFQGPHSHEKRFLNEIFGFQSVPIASSPVLTPPLRRAWVSCLCSLLAGIYTLWYDPSKPSFIHVKQVQCAQHLLSVRCTGLLIIFVPCHWTGHSVPCFSHTGRSRSEPSTSSVSCQCWVEGKCHLIFLAVLSLIEHRRLSPFFAVWEHCWLKG